MTDTGNSEQSLDDAAQRADKATPAESFEIMSQFGSRLQTMPNPFVVGVCHAKLLLPDDLDILAAELPSPETGTIQELEHRVAGAVEQANSTFLHLDLTLLDSFDQWTLVDLSNGDLLPGLDGENSTRKVTIFVPLMTTASNLDAEIRFRSVGKSRKIEAGEALMYPAFLSGQISTDGTGPVRGLLLFAHGPAFR